MPQYRHLNYLRTQLWRMLPASCSVTSQEKRRKSASTRKTCRFGTKVDKSTKEAKRPPPKSCLSPLMVKNFNFRKMLSLTNTFKSKWKNFRRANKSLSTWSCSQKKKLLPCINSNNLSIKTIMRWMVSSATWFLVQMLSLTVTRLRRCTAHRTTIGAVSVSVPPPRIACRRMSPRLMART